MLANALLGVSCELPTREEYIDLQKSSAQRETYVLDKYAFPGGYEIVYVLGDGEGICATCATQYLQERLENIGREIEEGWLDPNALELCYSSEEIISGLFSMDSTDSCAQCVECYAYMTASGCVDVCTVCKEEEYKHTQETVHAFSPILQHGEYCSYSLQEEEVRTGSHWDGGDRD